MINLSFRITEKHFSVEEITKIKEELEGYGNKSDFLRKVIRSYLSLDMNNNNEKENNENDLKALKDLVEENNKLLKSFKNGGVSFNYKENHEIYEGNEQEVQTEKVLNLLNQF